ncbi:ATP-binding cassette domain-containing protein, partial [Chloroflexota bacterium]
MQNDDPIIEVRNLSYTYPSGTRALEDLDLVVLPGEYVAVMGANGAGKTSLSLLLNGVIPHITG